VPQLEIRNMAKKKSLGAAFDVTSMAVGIVAYDATDVVIGDDGSVTFTAKPKGSRKFRKFRMELGEVAAVDQTDEGEYTVYVRGKVPVVETSGEVVTQENGFVSIVNEDGMTTLLNPELLEIECSVEAEEESGGKKKKAAPAKKGKKAKDEEDDEEDDEEEGDDEEDDEEDDEGDDEGDDEEEEDEKPRRGRPPGKKAPAKKGKKPAAKKAPAKKGEKKARWSS
jgi:hypothetical protein